MGDARDVVLCHGIEDGDKAESLARALEAEGFHVWLDRTAPNLPKAARRDAFLEAVGRAGSCVFLVTNDNFTRWQREQARLVSDRVKADPTVAVNVVLLGEKDLKWLPPELKGPVPVRLTGDDTHLGARLAALLRNEPPDEVPAGKGNAGQADTPSGIQGVPTVGGGVPEKTQTERQNADLLRKGEGKRPWRARPSGARRRALMALSGYLVVAVFAAGYGIVRLGWPDSTTRAAVIVGLLCAGPLALAFVWERLSGFKAFGVEVTLAEVAVSVDQSIVYALSSVQYFSGVRHIIAQIESSIRNPEVELLEVNLRSGPYWWSTRLFLQAALADDYSRIQRFVFVEDDDQRHYVGMASPHDVRRLLGQRFSYLEDVYRDLRKSVPVPLPPATTEVEWLVESWSAALFPPKDGVAEEKATSRLTGEDLILWFEGSLERDSVSWDDIPDAPLLQYLVLERGGRFVAIVRGGKLDRVVNADELARRRSLASLRQTLR